MLIGAIAVLSGIYFIACGNHVEQFIWFALFFAFLYWPKGKK